MSGGDSAARCGLQKTYANTNTPKHFEAFGVVAWCGGVRYPVGVALCLLFWGKARGRGNMIDNLRQGRLFFAGMTLAGVCRRYAIHIPFQIFLPKLLRYLVNQRENNIPINFLTAQS